MSKARDAYEIGRFDEAIGILKACLNSNAFTERQQQILAYRILSVSYIELDSMNQALSSANELITLDPSFDLRPEDPLRFQQLIRDLRQGLLRKLISSVSKSSESLAEAPATVVVIDEEDIADRGYQSIIDLLADIPGVNLTIGSGPAYTLVYQRGYRSVVTDRTLFLIDGVEENDLTASTAYISRQLPMTNIKRVEVIYGPASTMYGPNASVGVINVVTKNGEDIIKQGNNWGVKAEASYGTYNTKNVDVTVAGKYKNTTITLSGRRFLSEELDLSGYDAWDFAIPGDETYLENLTVSGTDNISSLLSTYAADSGSFFIVQGDEAIPTARAIDSAKVRDLRALNTELNGHLPGYSNQTDNWGFYGKLQVADLTVGYHTWFRSEGTQGWYNDRHAGTKNGEAWIVKNSFLYVKYEKALNDNLNLTVFTRYKAHELDDRTQFLTLNSYENGRRGLTNLLNGDEAAWSNLYFYRLSKQLRNEIRGVYATDRLSVVFGAEVRNSLIQGNYINSTEFPASAVGFPDTTNAGNYFNQRDIGVYAQGAYSVSKDIKLTLGGRIDDNKVRNDNLNRVFNPRVAIVYTPGAFVFKGIYGRAFKEASNLTKYATTSSRALNNPDLNPEIVNNYEFSALWQDPNRKWNAEMSAYFASYTGIISVIDVPYEGGTTQQFNNIGESEIKGVQASVTYTEDNWKAYFNYSFTDPRNTEDETGNVNERIADISSHSFNMGASFHYKGLRGSLGINYVGERKTVASIAGERDPVPAYTIVNSAISYSHRALPGVRLQLIGNNILDLDYVHPGIRSADGANLAIEIPQYRRRITLKAIYEF